MKKLRAFIQQRLQAQRRKTQDRTSQREEWLRTAPRGQVLVIVALGFIVLLVVVGFVVDVGFMYISMGHLRRAVDASSLAAADQYREGRTIAQMTAAASQVISLNGVNASTIQVQTCRTNPGDAELCLASRRKLVRVNGAMDSPTYFLSLVGIPNVHLTAHSISEAASMDVVLVIDISESMAYDTAPNQKRTDTSLCNADNSCQPFADVKTAAASFANRVLDQPAADESDRLAIVTFSHGFVDSDGFHGTKLEDIPTPATLAENNGWTSDRSKAIQVINGLHVYSPPRCPTASGPCRSYDPPLSNNYIGGDCPAFYDDPTWGPASCTTTNIGGGLRLAGNQFGNPLTVRADALWVTVLLTDGAANSSDGDSLHGHPFGFCPGSAGNQDWVAPSFCRDINTADWKIHPSARHASTSLLYDADDYARDMADFVGCDDRHAAAGCTQTGQNSLIYTIGLGSQVTDIGISSPYPPGVRLLRDIAAVGDDGNPSTDQCSGLYGNASDYTQWCGNYYFAPTGNRLTRVFEDIYSRMFVRITN